MKLESDQPCILPLYPHHQQLKAKIIPFANYWMPLHYEEGILKEHVWVRNNCGLFDVSHMGVIEVKEDQPLEKVIPLDLQDMLEGQVKYGFLVNRQGGIEDDLLIMRLLNRFLLVVNAARKNHDLTYLRENGIQAFLQKDYCLLALQGPKAYEIIDAFYPGCSHLSFMNFQEKDGCIISRTGYTGEDGFELILPSKTASELFLTFLSFPSVKPIGLGARDSLRLEAGLCLYGHDLNDSLTPIEAGLSWALGKRRKEKGGFLGDTVILDQLKSPPSKRRIGLKLLDKSIARENASIFLEEGELIGTVTSGTYSPILNVPIAMGYIKKEYAILNGRVKVNVRQKNVDAFVTSLPFVPHHYYRG
ncbi:MAG: glycine cleavage system aminomethyltransferase GcvT [Proteobacteria bacterium]|nr:glycine cleavage system aminomethyltransferase GcvT [Pseudomonadota bacterium]